MAASPAARDAAPLPSSSPSSSTPDLPMARRLVAAAGAAVVAATIVNPLDVIKTRMQAAAAAVTAGAPTAATTTTTTTTAAALTQGARSRSAAAPPPLPDPARLRAALAAAAAAVERPGEYHGTLYERWGILEEPLCVRRTPAMGAKPAAPAAAPLFEERSMLRAFRRIVQAEGLPAMWRGTGTSLAMAVPMVGIYMPLYDDLLASIERARRDHLAQRRQQHQQPASVASSSPFAALAGRVPLSAAPVAAGGLARMVAVLCVAPLELVRTRLQASSAAAGGPARAVDAVRDILSSAEASGGGGGSARASSPVAAVPASARALPRLWTGAGATLVRDVPFSALYWAMVEPLRHALLRPTGGSGSGEATTTEESAELASASPTHHHHPSRGEVLSANLAGGFLAGGAAAAATTPFDVVKTRMQLALSGGSGNGNGNGAATTARSAPPRGLVGTFVDVYRTGGVGALFSGVVPRSMRAAPACALVIGCYEVLKSALAADEQEEEEGAVEVAGVGSVAAQAATAPAPSSAAPASSAGTAVAALAAGRRGAAM